MYLLALNTGTGWGGTLTIALFLCRRLSTGCFLLPTISFNRCSPPLYGHTGDITTATRTSAASIQIALAWLLACIILLPQLVRGCDIQPQRCPSLSTVFSRHTKVHVPTSGMNGIQSRANPTYIQLVCLLSTTPNQGYYLGYYLGYDTNNTDYINNIIQAMRKQNTNILPVSNPEICTVPNPTLHVIDSGCLTSQNMTVAMVTYCSCTVCGVTMPARITEWES